MCTRVFWSDNAFAPIVGRTMDWPESTVPILTVLPRGMKRHGGRVGSSDVIDDHGVEWTSKYGSLMTSIYGIGTADGFNERGLGTHMLYLDATSFGVRDRSKRGLSAALWAQYLLDNAATVDEALSLLETVQVIMVEAHGHRSNVHLALEDASGDSAIVEYLAGERVIHHGAKYRIMTNDPTYDEQIALLARQDFSNPRSDMALPGNVNPVDRFQRAAYFTALLPRPKSEREAVAAMFAVIRNVSVPFGAPYKDFGIYNTEYRTVSNLAERRYFFELTTSPNVLWADLPRFDLTAGAPVMVLDPNDIELSGNVTERFERAAQAPF